MIRLLGCVLIAAGAGYWGFCAAARLRAGVRALEELTAGLTLLEHALTLSAPALPELMQTLSLRARGTAGRLFNEFALALEELGERSVSSLWERTVSGLEGLSPDAGLCLAPLGEILGRCDCGEQCAAVRAVRGRLEQLREEEQKGCRLRCRTCQTVGLSGGAFLIILLL